MGSRAQENQITSCTMFAWAAISKKTASEKKGKRYYLQLSSNVQKKGMELFEKEAKLSSSVMEYEKKGMELFEKETKLSSSVMEYDAHFQDTPEKVDLKCDEIMEDIFAADLVAGSSRTGIHEKIPDEMDKTTWQGKNAPKEALKIMQGGDAPRLACPRPNPIRV